MGKIRYPVDDPILHRCIGIALVQKRFIRASLKQTLYEKHLYADLHQELVTGAVEAWRLGWDPDEDFRLIKNLVQRRLYRFFKNNGIHRQWDPGTKKQGRGYFSREVSMSDPRIDTLRQKGEEDV